METLSATREQTLTALIEGLDQMVLAGNILEAADQYFADDVTTQQDNAEPVVGKATNRANLEAFLSSLKAFNGATLHSYAVGDDVTLSEYTFDLVAEDGSPLIWNEVIRRQWTNGQVINERYYTA